MRDIPVHTTCPHHLLGSSGTATVAYAPGERLVGVGTVAAVVDAFARRLALQEQIGQSVVAALAKHLSPRWVACRLVLSHGCMTARGERAHGARVETVALAGSAPTAPPSTRSWGSRRSSRSTPRSSRPRSRPCRSFRCPGSCSSPAPILPLHIFEPRYRKMVADCMAGHRCMAMAFTEGGGEDPRIAPVAGAGIIVRYEPMSDGRSTLLLHGRARVLLEELPFEAPTGAPMRAS